MKRSLSRSQISSELDQDEHGDCIDSNTVMSCKEGFREDPMNMLKKNTVVAVGSLLPCTNEQVARNVTHIFENTIKKKGLPATNQGYSGRCWLFAALNIFRHHMVNALNLESFEFSETYLFFWDKFERSNTLLQYFIDNSVEPSNRVFQWYMQEYLGDGGYWNMAANLIQKYGVVPKSAMPETFQSDWTDDMNTVLCRRLRSFVCSICKMKKAKKERNELMKAKKEYLHCIYRILVMYLGEPPEKFSWYFTIDDEDHHGSCITDLTPQLFQDLSLHGTHMTDDFIILTHIPSHKYYQMYELEHSSNTIEGQNLKAFNVPMNELKKYTKKSLLSGMPVWFASDVSHDLHPYSSAFDSKLVDDSLLFGSCEDFTKEDKVRYLDVQGNHAMCFIGLNMDSNNQPTYWQVENSWGYLVKDEPGADGYFAMSNDYFENNVTEVVIHKEFISRSILQKVSTQNPVLIQPWSAFGRSMMAVNDRKTMHRWRKANTSQS